MPAKSHRMVSAQWRHWLLRTQWADVERVLAATAPHMTIIPRLVEWLRRREPRGDDGARPIRKSSERRERQPDVEQIEELVRIVGEADASEPRPHTKPTNERRIRSRPR
jgi:hypothetical protein